MTKFLPYQQYDVQAIEQWLNRQSLNGYRLVKMDGVFPQFKKYIDHQIFYRVRYCPTTPISSYDHFWGKLYIYEAFSKDELPAPNYLRDSMEAASRQQKPWFVLALLIALVATLQYLLTGSPTTPALVCGTVTIVSALAWIALIGLNFYRGIGIAKGAVDPAVTPPAPWVNTLLTTTCLLTVLLYCILVLLAEGVL